MEIPVYEIFLCLIRQRQMGELSACIAIPERRTNRRSRVNENVEAKYIRYLMPPEKSNYEFAEEQMVREIAHKMTRTSFPLDDL